MNLFFLFHRFLGSVYSPVYSDAGLLLIKLSTLLLAELGLLEYTAVSVQFTKQSINQYSRYNTIYGNLKFVHFRYSWILTSQVSIHFSCSTKLILIVIILKYCLSYSKTSAILCVLYFQFLHFFILSWKT